ncbi:S-adenosylmethionine:tRNA ribosyltransferase-isomerase [Gammaproteobacteria bacterium]|nr:S-adenosylmethionine:tRNA ribosyltransferase-isomerase [Gammaproteobacteria bacterium]
MTDINHTNSKTSSKLISKPESTSESMSESMPKSIDHEIYNPIHNSIYSSINDYDYSLPQDLIAQFPPKIRGDSRLLVAQNKEGLVCAIKDHAFNELLSFLKAGDLLVLNNTRVLPARIFAQKATGGQCEILVERVLSETTILAHIRASKSPKVGQTLLINGIPQFIMHARSNTHIKSHGLPNAAELQNLSDNPLFILETIDKQAVLPVLEAYGHMPLPPYIERADELDDLERYQTVFSQEKGAVAAPTAGLHFTTTMLAALKEKGIECNYITLHVGAGTFQPVRVDLLEDHHMHYEWINVPKATIDAIALTKSRGKRVIAVGTTVVRALETAALAEPLSAFTGETNIFIKEGFEFKVIDGLLTNFHLPKSTLLVLVSALMGHEQIKHIYQHAIKQKYHFFSYGDAMLLLP